MIKKQLTILMKNIKSKGNINMSTLYRVPKKEADSVDQPLIVITKQAYDKMYELVQQCNIEIAWHNTVQRKGNTFTILDTLCYPQTATHVTVESDDESYPIWQEDLDDDTYNALRMQGHSHVNMGVGPSSTDEDYYDTMLSHVKTFYIFLIMNKRGQVYARIYDYTNNYVYENTDIDLAMPEEASYTWAEEQIDMFVTKVTADKRTLGTPYFGSNAYQNY